ncbi:MAG: hypothetical protein DCF23_00535 [Cyanobium sp.]|nr:MAG: hypothetical protein DCF23_00535 [Cyanobium sp.]
MVHHQGIQALELLVLSRKLTHSDAFVFQLLIARMHPLTGRVWSTSAELTAAIGKTSNETTRSISKLKRLGVIVRCKGPKLEALPQLEQRLMPDPAARGPHSARLHFLIDPLVASVGGQGRRAATEEQFREALGGRDTALRMAMSQVVHDGELTLGAVSWRPRQEAAAA